jgi:hypothetical protein
MTCALAMLAECLPSRQNQLQKFVLSPVLQTSQISIVAFSADEGCRLQNFDRSFGVNGDQFANRFPPVILPAPFYFGYLLKKAFNPC